MKIHKLTDGNICYFCGIEEVGKNSSRSLIEFHHIIERHNGGSNDHSNLVPCCSNCHSKIHIGLIQPKKWLSVGYCWKLEWVDEKGVEHFGSRKL